MTDARSMLETEATAELTDGKHIALALYEVADAIRAAARHLGTNDAATPMGAIELLASEVKSAAETHARALGTLAEAIQDSAD